MRKKNRSVQVSGIPLFSFNIQKAIDIVEVATHSERNNYCISATGAHGIIYAQKHPDFKELLDNFFINLPDGMPGVWVGRLKGAKEMERCYGPDFFAEMMKDSADKNIKHFLCGGMEGVADKLKIACEEKFNNHNIVGTFCPPFKKVNEYDYEGIADLINETGADIVWVGISTPKQEQFAWRLSKHINVHFLITVGAAFDFHIGNVKQAPSWMQRNGLEWFYRLLMEPKRLWRRYIEIVPLFIFYAFIDILKFKFLTKKNRNNE